MIRDRSILALLVAEVVSSLGSQFTALALPWFVLITTGSPTKMGLVFAAELVPMALLGYLRRGRFVAQVSVSSLTFGFLFRILVASFPVLAYREYHHNPRVAGLLLSTIGAGQVVGSLLAYRLVTVLPPLRMAAVAAVFTAAPLWLLVPHVPLAVAGTALAVCGASVPLINAPYLGLLSTRIPKALRGKVIQSLITINFIVATRSPGAQEAA